MNESDINRDAMPLSVIICTYNRADFLKQALASLNAQTLSKDRFEIVVIDDGSTDNTRDVIEPFIPDLPIKYFYQKNAGLASARNHGIFAARGEILLFLDDDDIATPSLLEQHLKTHQEYPEENYAVLHYTTWAPHILVTPLMQFITEVGCFLFAYPYIKDGDVLDYKNFWGGRTSCKRSFLLNHGIFNPLFTFGNEDTELGYRLSKHNLKIVYNANAIAYMIRPIDFEGFCRRLIKQGKSNYISSRLHRDKEVDEWCEVAGAADKWSEIKPEYEDLLNSARELDKIARLKVEYGFSLDEPSRRLLHNAYWKAFNACKLKGLIEEKEKEELYGSGSETSAIVSTKKAGFTVVAIICAYNEGDIIYHTLKHLIEEGISVYLMDHSSTDNTVVEASKWLGKGLIHIEKFPQESGFPEALSNVFALRSIMKRVEQLHRILGADWYMHYDADEFREAPWSGMSLKEAIRLVDDLGYNAINFELLNFRPTDNSYVPGHDVREYLHYYESAEEFNEMQIKAWKNFGQAIDLSSTAGHMVSFEGRKTFPIKFITLHFPVRSHEHGIKKILRERANRFDRKEKALGWHIQYSVPSDGQPRFIYDKANLIFYDPDKVRVKLLTEAVVRLDSSREKS